MKTYMLADLRSSEVAPIVDDVRNRGDLAVKDLTAHFDNVTLDKIVECVADLPDPELDPAVQAAFDVAYDNIRAFHAAQQIPEQIVENIEGVRCKRVARSIHAVGLYVPGGTAVLPSTALMLAVPAQIAGCKLIVLATPPKHDGSICKEVLYCAKENWSNTHTKRQWCSGGCSHGLGNCFLSKGGENPWTWKSICYSSKDDFTEQEAMVSIDMPAGPSEVLVIADKHASPVYVAADLLSQAEHGPDSQVALVAAGDGVNLNAIETELEKQCKNLPRRAFAAKALTHSYTVLARDVPEAISFSNLYAPEHLIVNVEDAEQWEHYIENAGSVFLGRWSPESVGDYASGTNHVLPTYGYARMYGGVSLDSFTKHITVQILTEHGLKVLGPHVIKMAETEGLEAHKRAVALWLQDIEMKPFQ